MSPIINANPSEMSSFVYLIIFTHIFSILFFFIERKLNDMYVSLFGKYIIEWFMMRSSFLLTSIRTTLPSSSVFPNKTMDEKPFSRWKFSFVIVVHVTFQIIMRKSLYFKPFQWEVWNVFKFVSLKKKIFFDI